MGDFKKRYKILNKLIFIGRYGGIIFVTGSLLLFILKKEFQLSGFYFTKDLWEMTFWLGIYLLTLGLASYGIKNSLEMSGHNIKEHRHDTKENRE